MTENKRNGPLWTFIILLLLTIPIALMVFGQYYAGIVGFTYLISIFVYIAITIKITKHEKVPPARRKRYWIIGFIIAILMPSLIAILIKLFFF